MFVNGLTKQSAVPDAVLHELGIHERFDLRRDFRCCTYRFAISQSFNPELLKAAEIVVDALHIAPEVSRQFRCTPVQADDARPQPDFGVDHWAYFQLS